MNDAGAFPIKVETAEPGDIERLVTDYAEAFTEAMRVYGSGPPGYNEPGWHVQMLSDHTYLKITSGDLIVGGIIIREFGDREYFLDALFIRPSHQSLGLGRQVMKYIQEVYREARKWSLVTPYRDYRNHYFYEGLGYEKVGEIPVARGGLIQISSYSAMRS